MELFCALELVFVDAYQLAESEGQHEVDNAYDEQGFDSQEGCAPYGQVGGHQIAYEEGGSKGGFLDYHDKLIAQRRKDVLYSLRKNHLEHGLGLVKAKAAGSFGLTLVNRLYTGADYFGYICRAVYYQSDGNAGIGLNIESGQRHGQDEVEQIQLKQYGRTTDNFDKGGNNAAEELKAAHLAQSKESAKYCAEEYGDKRQRDGYAETLDKEYIPILGHYFCYVFAESLKGHGILLMFAAVLIYAIQPAES